MLGMYFFIFATCEPLDKQLPYLRYVQVKTGVDFFLKLFTENIIFFVLFFVFVFVLLVLFVLLCFVFVLFCFVLFVLFVSFDYCDKNTGVMENSKHLKFTVACSE